MNFLNKKTLAFVQIFLVISLVFVLSFSLSSNSVVAEEEQVCCEKDNDGNYCNYVPASKCTGNGVLKASTSCDQTSFCKPGCCAGINGFCYNNYAKALCERRYNGSYNSDPSCGAVSECKSGCCIIGTQAAYLTRNRCIEETSKFPDLEVDFRESVANEQECLNLARNTEKGCCVTSDRNCKYGAKSECTVENVLNGTGFYKDTFCSNLRNNCDCAPADKTNPRATMCLPNDDRVFWKDSCGNPEGVVSGIDLTKYGGAVVDGNCDYNKGNLCGDSNKDGIYVCETLACQTGTKLNSKLSVNMKNYDGHGTAKSEILTGGLLNGESWCTYDSPDQEQKVRTVKVGDKEVVVSTADRGARDPVGSRYYRHLCINGIELVEPCKDFREEYCYAQSVNVNIDKTNTQKYTESRCVSNQWKPCVDECNTANPATMDQFTYTEAIRKDQECCAGAKRDCLWTGNRCVPAVTPGFKFWEGEGANICGKANTQCTAIFRCGGFNKLLGACGASKDASGAVGGVVGAAASAGLAVFLVTGPVGWAAAAGAILGGVLIGTSSRNAGWQIVSGGECLSQDYLQASNNLCRSLGDCGANFNYQDGYESGHKNNELTLGRSGFTNTQNIDGELVNYVKDPSNLGDLQRRKSNPSRSDNITFDFSDGVPGKLKGLPDWGLGSDFYNFNTQKRELDNQFKRLFTQSEIAGLDANGAAGFFSGPVGLSLLASVGGGIIGGASFGVQGIGYGFASSSPLGFLVSKIAGFLGDTFAKGATDKIGLKATEESIKEGVKNSANVQKAAQGASESAKDSFTKFVDSGAAGPLTKEQALAWDKAVGDTVGKNYAGKLNHNLGNLKQFSGADVKAAQNSLGQGQVGMYTDKAGQQFLITKEGAQTPIANLKGSAAKNVGDQASQKVADGAASKVSVTSQLMAGVNAAMWIYTIYQVGDVLLEGTKEVTVSTTCSPWQPPVYKTSGTDDPCKKCNPQNNPGKDGYVNVKKEPQDIRAFKACSEYRCKSLGPSCELINKGTTEETCVSISKQDVNSPKIDPWVEGFTLGIKKEDISANNNGFIVKKKIPIYTPFSVGITTDEPSQCKMSFDHSKRYADMENNFFGGNIFNYFHVNTMVYPASKVSSGGGNSTGISLTGGGHYKLYLRCIDAAGNANENDYSIEFDVGDEPDLTAPTIVGSSLSPPVPVGLLNQSTTEREVYLMNGANYTDITLFVNEPSECRYSYVPLDFSFMNETTSCKTTSGRPDAAPFYSCKFLRGLQSTFAGIGPAPSGFTSKAGLIQSIYFKCRDHPEAGYKETRNFNKDAYKIVLKGSDPLDIVRTSPSGLIKTSNSLVDVKLEVVTSGGALLNGISTCKYTTDDKNRENLAYMTEFLNTGSSLHTQPWQPSNGNQNFYIGCHDQAGNREFTNISFTVERDLSAPVITRVYRDNSFQPSQFIVEINEPGECKDSTVERFDFDLGGNLMIAVPGSGRVFSSTVTDSNIYYVVCRDLFNNTMPSALVQIAQV